MSNKTSLAITLVGTIDFIYDEHQISDKFTKREFAIKVDEEYNGKTYTKYFKLQFTNDKCDKLNGFKVGDMVIAQANVSGMRNEKDGNIRYFNNLEAWRIEKDTNCQEPQPTAPTYSSNHDDDMPF